MNIYKLWSVSHFLRSKIISPQWFFSKPSCSKSVWRNCQKTEEKIVQKHENISIDKKKGEGKIESVQKTRKNGKFCKNWNRREL